MSGIGNLSLQELIDALKAQGFKVERDGDGNRKGAILDERYFRRADMFSGDVGKWSEWLFNLLVCLGQASIAAEKAVERVVDGKQTFVNSQQIRDLLVELGFGDGFYEKFSGELFSVVCGITSGEANGVVRGVVAKGFGYCGFAALSQLAHRYNPKTPARLLQCVLGAISPAPVKNVRDLPRAIQDWETLLAKLSRDFSENLSPRIKVAVFVGMLPKEFQEMVWQLGSGGEEMEYEAVKDKIMAVATHRAQMAQPTPMDIGAVEGSRVLEEFEVWPHENGTEIMSMGKGGSGRCLRCGGWGHFARECGTPIGKGDFSKGKGKGWGEFGKGKGGDGGNYFKGPQKGWPKGETWKGSKGAKGLTKGGGYQGTCFTCGQVGHKAGEGKCGGKGVYGMEAEIVEDEGVEMHSLEVGGVWTLGCIENPPGLCNGKELCAVENQKEMEMKFQVCDVKKALGAVWRICDAGNVVQFGPRSEDCFIKNLKSGEKVAMRREGRSYVVDLVFDGGGKSKFTVDSAAEESACPWEWGKEFSCKQVRAGEQMKLINASGGKIEHWGSRRVKFSTF